MIVSPWQSTVLKQHKLGTLLSELTLAYASNELAQSPTGVTFVTPRSSRVPTFTLPITPIEYDRRKMAHSPHATVMDARSFTRLDRTGSEGYVIANQMQADFWFRIGTLTGLWVRDEAIRNDFLRAGDIAAQTYIRWISQVVISKLGLDMEVGREVQILTAAYYIHQFHEAEDIISDRGREKTVRLIQRWSRYPSDVIEKVVSDLPYMTLMEDYVAALHTYFQHSTRIGQINVGLLVMSVGHAWFGYGAREIAAVAVEYPPVFLALVEAACNTKTWKKTFLGKIVDKLNVGRAADSFVRSMELLSQTASTEAYCAEQLGFAEGEVVQDLPSPVVSTGGVDNETIQAAEQRLQVYFSTDYKNFLREHGSARIGGHQVNGLGAECPTTANVVDATQARTQMLKPGRYVVDNTSVSGRALVSDAVGRLYLATQSGEQLMSMRFTQWIDHITTEAQVSLEHYSLPWEGSEYKGGWSMTEQTTWWGGKSLPVEMLALGDDQTPPSQEQICSYREFCDSIQDHVTNTRKAVQQYCRETLSRETSDPFDIMSPIQVVFDRQGDWCIRFDENAHGMCIYSRGGMITVVRQDDAL